MNKVEGRIGANADRCEGSPLISGNVFFVRVKGRGSNIGHL